MQAAVQVVEALDEDGLRRGFLALAGLLAFSECCLHNPALSYTSVQNELEGGGVTRGAGCLRVHDDIK
jgi:hypothetical protein